MMMLMMARMAQGRILWAISCFFYFPSFVEGIAPKLGHATTAAAIFTFFRSGISGSPFRTCVIVCHCNEGGRMYKRAMVKVAASGGDNNRKKSCV